MTARQAPARDIRVATSATSRINAATSASVVRKPRMHNRIVNVPRSRVDEMRNFPPAFIAALTRSLNASIADGSCNPSGQARKHSVDYLWGTADGRW